MELNRKYLAIVLVVLFLGSVGAIGVTIAQTPASSSTASSASTATPAGSFQMAPINPVFTQYVNAKAAGTVVTQQGLGNIPGPIDFSKMYAGQGSDYAAAYPATYDLRTLHKVSPVGDQDGCGNCWTFGTYGSLESYLLPASTTQFSEKALNAKSGFSLGCCNGGWWMMAAAYFERWGTTMKYANGGTISAGPVTATCDPFTTPYCPDTKTCPVAEHVQKVVMFPGRANALDNNAIKYGLMTYGALDVGFQWEGDQWSHTQYWNPTTGAYYDGTTTGGNHAVTIVGWNDNFPKTSFSTTPPGNGAFIVKNSWSTSWGKSGYFYVSYYDKNIGVGKSKWDNEAVAFTGTPTANYKTNYEYDPLGWVSNIGAGTNTLWAANVFTAQAGTLKAVGLYAPVKNTAYTIKVYKNPSSTNPASGTLVATTSGTVSYVGYYTATLPTSVPLSAGQKFSVVIKYTTQGWNYPNSVTEKLSGYSNNIPIAVKGHSFASTTGTSWVDLSSAFAGSQMANDILAFAS